MDVGSAARLAPSLSQHDLNITEQTSNRVIPPYLFDHSIPDQATCTSSRPDAILVTPCPANPYRPLLVLRSVRFKHMTPSLGRQSGSTCSTRMPTSFLSIKNMYDADEYILKDGEKNAQCTQTQGVQDAVTGTAEFYVAHMLYADDLNPMANDPVALQTMLNRLH
eukprot:991033-Pelagomonas_calceolata.AAC.1